jgi:hypothetical protein
VSIFYIFFHPTKRLFSPFFIILLREFDRIIFTQLLSFSKLKITQQIQNLGDIFLHTPNAETQQKNISSRKTSLRKRDAHTSPKKRSQTLSTRRMAREHRKMRAQGEMAPVVGLNHPTSRAQCVNMPRPCLYVSCRHHLYLDVNEETGSVKFNFPDKEVWELEETCALDVADRGGITLEEVGLIMNLTRERIRQLELSGLEKLRVYTKGEDNLESYAKWDPNFDETSSCN